MIINYVLHVTLEDKRSGGETSTDYYLTAENAENKNVFVYQLVHALIDI